MTNYKVGDIAALFPEPKEPATEGGKKLQSLFKEFHSKKKGFSSSSLENIKEEKEQVGSKNKNSEALKNSLKKKNKFPAINDRELKTDNLKNVNKPHLQNIKTDFSKEKYSNLSAQRDFPRKKNKFNKKANSISFNTAGFDQSETDADNNSKTGLIKPNKNHHMENNYSNKNYKYEKYDASSDNSKIPSKKRKFSKISNTNEFNEAKMQDVKSNQNEKGNGNFVRDIPRKKQKFNQDLGGTFFKNRDFMKSKNTEIHTATNVSNDSSPFKRDRKKHNEKFPVKNSYSGRKHNISFNNNTIPNMKMKFSFMSNVESKNDSLESNESGKQNARSDHYEETTSNIPVDFPRKRKKVFKTTNATSFTEEGFAKSEIDKNQTENADILTDSFSFKSSPRKDKKNYKKDNYQAKEHVFNENVNFNNSNRHNKKIVYDDDSDSKQESNENKKAKNKKMKKHLGGENKLTKNLSSHTSHNEKIAVKEENKLKHDKEALSCTLFVGNLPLDTTKRSLRKLFSSFGPISDIRFGTEFDKERKKPTKLYYAAESLPGFIVFEQRQSAVEALSLNGSVFKGHHITVDFAVPLGCKKLYDDKRSIFIGNLPFGVKDDDVWEAFSECGKIQAVRVVRDHATGIAKGFGYVQFVDVESKDNALALKGLRIQERLIRIHPIISNTKEEDKFHNTTFRRDSFKSKAIRMKKKSQQRTNSRKSVKKIMKKQKGLHKKKKIASLLQKTMK